MKRQRADLMLGEQWYQALRFPRFKRLGDIVPRSPFPVAKGPPALAIPPGLEPLYNAARVIHQAQQLEAHIQREIAAVRASSASPEERERRIAALEARLPDWRALSERLGVPVDQLDAILERYGVGGPIIGEWARVGRIRLGDHLILPPPAEPIRMRALLELIQREAPEGMWDVLIGILRARHTRGRSGWPASLLRPGEMRLNEPKEHYKRLLEACLWLAERLTKQEEGHDPQRSAI